MREVLRAAAADRGQARSLLFQAALDGDRVGLRTQISKQPELARLYGLEDLLGAWSSAAQHHKGALAARMLSAARGIGGALTDFNRDFLLLDSVEAIEAATASDPWRLALLLLAGR